jgi:hypothetical protein
MVIYASVKMTSQSKGITQNGVNGKKDFREGYLVFRREERTTRYKKISFHELCKFYTSSIF